MVTYRREVISGRAADEVHDSEDVMQGMVAYHERWSKPVEEVQYGRDGSVEQQTLYEYDENGFLIREVLHEADGEISEEKSFEPDEKGRVKNEYRHYADGSFDTLAYHYDEAGHIVSRVLTDDEGVIEWREEYLYQADLLMMERVYDGDDVLTGETVYLYDKEGLLEEKMVSDKVEETLTKHLFSYDDSGRRDGVLTYNEKGELVERHLLTLDSQGRPVGVVEETRKKKNHTRMEYNGLGHVVFQEETDMHGNMVARVERRYNAEGLLEESEVIANHPFRPVPQHYIIRQTYEFFEQS